MFQAIQKPKSNKFSCRVCSARQSVRTAYATSDKAKDCRGVVQQYNRRYGDKKEEEDNFICPGVEILSVGTAEARHDPVEGVAATNHWEQFLSEDDNEEEEQPRVERFNSDGDQSQGRKCRKRKGAGTPPLDRKFQKRSSAVEESVIFSGARDDILEGQHLASHDAEKCSKLFFFTGERTVRNDEQDFDFDDPFALSKNTVPST
jgi:hypothetical protein